MEERRGCLGRWIGVIALVGITVASGLIGGELSDRGEPADPSGPADPGEMASSSEPGAGPAERAAQDDDGWAPLRLLTVVNAADLGAVGDGRADDTSALQRAIDSVPDDGGILWFPPGRTYRTTDVIRISGDHVKLWAPDGQARILATTEGRERRQALIVDEASGVGIFGLRFGSDSELRRLALEDSAVVVDGSTGTELVGLEITGSASAAIFVFGSTRTWVVGNDIHDNWADAVHFTDGSRQAWVWDNVIVNREPTPGDDGVACVTYGSGPRCGSMEWWDNLHLGGGWGRGLSVVGGDEIHMHDNVIADTAAAGILVASESSYDTPGSDAIRIEDNVVCRAGHTIPHSGILISGLDGAITDVVVSDNDVVDSHSGEAFRAEGEVEDLVERRTSAGAGDRCPTDSAADTGPVARGTAVLATRDVSFAPSEVRRGLNRIQVRSTAGGGFEQRLEYVVAGPAGAVDAWLGDEPDAVARYRSSAPGAGDDQFAVVLAGSPLVVPASLRPIGFEELRALAAGRPELWEHLDDW